MKIPNKQTKKYILYIGLPVLVIAGVLIHGAVSKTSQGEAAMDSAVASENNTAESHTAENIPVAPAPTQTPAPTPMPTPSPTPYEESEYSNFAIANVHNYVNVRKEPNTKSEIVGKMYDGSVAEILEETLQNDGKWFKVISGQVEGYIRAEYFIFGDEAVEILENFVTNYAIVKADRLNVREEPDKSSKRIGYVTRGEKIKILEPGEEWVKVEYRSGKTGYVAAEYISTEEAFTYAKSIEEEKAEIEERKTRIERENSTEEEAPEDTTISVPVDPPATDYSSVSELRSSIVNYAMQFVGMRYVHGGQSLSGGTDCSGFTSLIFKEFGISLSRTPQGQWGGNGRRIDVSEIQPGDIVCYAKGSKCTHVGIYIGDGKIVHEANSRRGCVVDDMYYDSTFIGVINVID